MERLDVHAPARLARPSASQGLWVDACQRMGGAVVCCNREWGRSPADALLLQVPGRLAEEERAQLVARHRRGPLHAARAGAGLAWRPVWLSLSRQAEWGRPRPL